MDWLNSWSDWLVLLVGLGLGLAVATGAVLFVPGVRAALRRLGGQGQAAPGTAPASAAGPENGNAPGDHRMPRGMILFVAAAGLLIAGIAWLVVNRDRPDSPEIQMGLIIVLAIAALMTLLFVMAGGFSHLGLATQQHALGLPEGSIRAMIALILIMVFILFGIYLFRMVGTGLEDGPVRVDSLGEAVALEGSVSRLERVEDGANPGTVAYYNAWVRTEMGDDGRALAQQLVTTVGTLVVAVAGFYFGSTAVSNAASAARQEAPTVASVVAPTAGGGSAVATVVGPTRDDDDAPRAGGPGPAVSPQPGV